MVRWEIRLLTSAATGKRWSDHNDADLIFLCFKICAYPGFALLRRGRQRNLRLKS
jgi:hypothetical protein